MTRRGQGSGGGEGWEGEWSRRGGRREKGGQRIGGRGREGEVTGKRKRKEKEVEGEGKEKVRK